MCVCVHLASLNGQKMQASIQQLVSFSRLRIRGCCCLFLPRSDSSFPERIFVTTTRLPPLLLLLPPPPPTPCLPHSPELAPLSFPLLCCPRALLQPTIPARVRRPPEQREAVSSSPSSPQCLPTPLRRLSAPPPAVCLRTPGNMATVVTSTRFTDEYQLYEELGK